MPPPGLGAANVGTGGSFRGGALGGAGTSAPLAGARCGAASEPLGGGTGAASAGSSGEAQPVKHPTHKLSSASPQKQEDKERRECSDRIGTEQWKEGNGTRCRESGIDDVHPH
jgi:hypothetical protein